MSSLQRRLAVITDMQLAAITSAADLASRLCELEGLRERVKEALEVAIPEGMECYGAAKVPSSKAAASLHSGRI
jgi:hypothetical protein